MDGAYPRDELPEKLHPVRRLIAGTAILAASAPAVIYAYVSSLSPPTIMAVAIGIYAIGWLLVCGSVAGMAIGRLTPPVLLFLAIVVGLSVYFATASWPFQSRFDAAYSTLNRLAGDYRAGREQRLPVDAASFRIIKVDERHDAVTLWMDGEAAFVQTVEDPSGWFSLGECHRMDGGWWYVVED